MAETAAAYPVQTSFAKPQHYDRVQLLLRIAIWIVVGWVVNALLWIVFLGGPIVSTLLITRRGSDGFHETYGEDYTKLLAF